MGVLVLFKTLQKDPVISETRIWVAMALVLFPLLILFFKPTLLECLGFYLIDLAGYYLCQTWDLRLFHRFRPRSRLFFPELDPELLQMRELEKKKAVYRDMLTFPRDRALFIGLVSTIKVIPCFLFGVVVWHHHQTPLIIALKGLGICAFTFSFLIGMSYLGYHNRISRMLQDVHAKADWSDVFKAIDNRPQYKLFQKFEIIAAVSIWTFLTFMLILIAFTPDTPSWLSAAQAFYVSLAGFYFSAQLVMTSQHQITQGLEYLTQFHHHASEVDRSRGLALSTDPTLAFYQRTLNELIDKNTEQEKEIHRWILRQTADSRYLHLGRMTGHLVHDLLTPLTVMRYSLSVLDEQKAIMEHSQSYAEQLRFSLDQTTDFIKNIRGSIRDQSNGYRAADLLLAHQSATQLISYMYDVDKFRKIKIEGKLNADLKAAIPQPELNQVLLNLYSNAVKNLLDNRIAEPRLIIQTAWESEDQFILVIKDNGTGLSAATFHYITEEAERLPGQEGIGLKLTKRLIELYGGSLKLAVPVDSIGSEFHLTLCKVSKNDARRPPSGLDRFSLQTPVHASQQPPQFSI